LKKHSLIRKPQIHPALINQKLMTEKSRVLQLNVGGKKFDTYLSTFESVPLLHRRLASSDIGFREHNGRIFLDRDPKSFAIFLRVLRGGSELTLEERLTANKEFEFWASESTLPVSFPIKGTVYRVHWDDHGWDLPMNIVDEYLPALADKLARVCRRSADDRIDLADSVTNGIFYQNFSAVLRLIRAVQDPSHEMNPKDWHFLHKTLGLTEKIKLRTPPGWEEFSDLNLYVEEYNFSVKLQPDTSEWAYLIMLSDTMRSKTSSRPQSGWPPRLPEGLIFKEALAALPKDPNQIFKVCWSLE
jgi:hypothetical protein